MFLSYIFKIVICVVANDKFNEINDWLKFHRNNHRRIAAVQFISHYLISALLVDKIAH